MSETKLQIGIYKIDTDHECFKDCSSIIESLSIDIKEENKSYCVQEIRDGLSSKYDMVLLYMKRPLSPKWKQFLSSIAKDDQDILKKNQGKSESFILLLFNNQSQNLYAITGGLGHHAIQNVIEDDFGLDIISRLIKKEDKILKAIREKSVMGGILGATKYFRKTYNLYENDSFGKIYQELKAGLDKKMLTAHFGFAPEEIKKNTVCVAKSSFKINKSITFDQLLNVVDGCETVLSQMVPNPINDVIKIEKKQKSLIEKLRKEISTQLWERYQDEDADIDFDLCHKEYEQYLTANYYLVKKKTSQNNYFNDDSFDTLENIDSLFEKIKEQNNFPQNFDQFEELLNALKIYSYSEDGAELTSGYLLKHLFGDVSYDGNRYFLIDGNWYLIKPSFLAELNQSCQAFIDVYTKDILDKPWDHANMKENDYNQLYIGNPQTLVLDKITPRKIEPCDILKWDNNNLYLIHVKKSFGNTMRDLCSQIYISAKELAPDSRNSQKFIEEIYEHLQNKIESDDPYYELAGKQTLEISKNQFVDLFKSKELVFILATLDTAKDNRSINDITKFNSNIAKFSLQELIISMKGIGVALKITQIDRQDTGLPPQKRTGS